MAKRAQFWQVARGVLTAFASRNNDVRGYWGIGVLARILEERGLSHIELPLYRVASHKSEPVVLALAARYSELLLAKMSNSAVPASWLASAEIVFRYPTAAAIPHRLGANAPGQPFECTLTVTDDQRRSRAFSWSGWCWPQGAGPESRSARTHDL